jgi:hypothetical protein
MAEKEFNKPLDTPIDEEIEVERTQFELSPDGKTAHIKKVIDKVVVKTIYSRKELYSNICRDFDHNFTVPDIHNWTAVCTKCPKRIFLDPIKETVIDGKIVSRSTKQQIR